jgi:hypothetical protein
VRAHLVCLRGAGLFLSSADALLLLQWLDAEVSVPRILRALERAAEARRAKRSRFPLQLTHARRHLDKPTKGAFAREAPRGAGGPLAPVARALATAPRSAAHEALQRTLDGLKGHDAEALFREAAAAVRRFLDARWQELTDEERGRLRQRALDELGDLATLVDDDTRRSLVEEGARDLLRAGYPALSAASLWEVVEATVDEA